MLDKSIIRLNQGLFVRFIIHCFRSFYRLFVYL